MANYKTLEAYSVFTPPSNQVLFPSYIPAQLEQNLAGEVQSSPSQTNPDEVGSSVQQIPVRSHWELKSSNPKHYEPLKSNPIRPDDFHKFGDKNKSESHQQTESSQKPKSESPVQNYSTSPAQSQMYAMKRK